MSIPCSNIFPILCVDPEGSYGFHNTYTWFITLFVIMWVSYRINDLIQYYEIYNALMDNIYPIKLSSLGPYAHELKTLFKIHISQIIREKRLISPVPLKRVVVTSSVDVSSLSGKIVNVPSSSSTNDQENKYQLKVSFNMDINKYSIVHLFWGVKSNVLKDLLNHSYITTEKSENKEQNQHEVTTAKDYYYQEMTENDFYNSFPIEITAGIYYDINQGVPIDIKTRNTFSSMTLKDDYYKSINKSKLKNFNKVRKTSNVKNKWQLSVLGKNFISFFKLYKDTIGNFAIRNSQSDATRSLLELSNISMDDTYHNLAFNESMDENVIDKEILNDFIRNIKEDYSFKCSEPLGFSIGSNQQYISSIVIKKDKNSKTDDDDINNYMISCNDKFSMSFKDMKMDNRIPLLIMIQCIEDENNDISNTISQLIAVNLSGSSGFKLDSFVLDAYKQFFIVKNGIIEPLESYGLEDDEEECLICMARSKNALLLPCRHCSTCEACLRALRQDKCPICRTTFIGFVVLPIFKKDELLDQY